MVCLALLSMCVCVCVGEGGYLTFSPAVIAENLPYRDVVFWLGLRFRFR